MKPRAIESIEVFASFGSQKEGLPSSVELFRSIFLQRRLELRFSSEKELLARLLRQPDPGKLPSCTGREEIAVGYAGMVVWRRGG